MNKRIRLLISVLFIISIALLVALTKMNFDSENYSVNVINTPNIKSITKISYGDYRVFKGDSNLLGIIDNNNKVIIDPIWNDIRFINSERFIVTKKSGGATLSGIIDNQDSIVIPFIYKKFENINSDIIIGYLDSSDKIVLFNMEGNPFISEEWDEFTIENDFLYLKKNNCEYTGKVEENKLIFSKLNIDEEILNKKFHIAIYGKKYNITNNYKLFEELIYNTIKIIENIFTENYSKYNIYLSTDEYINMTEYDLINVTGVNVDLYKNEDNITCYSFTLDIRCNHKNDSEIANKNITITTIMQKNKDGYLTLSDINIIENN